MIPYNYLSCELSEHESEFLNIVCIDELCKNKRLLCSYCLQGHQKCKKIPLRKFTKIFKDQIDSINFKQLNQENKDLIIHLDQIEATLDKSQKLFHDTFNQIKQTIHYAKQSVNQMSNSSQQNQCFILQQFESEPSYENFNRLLSEIETFKPNSDKISFTIKKNNSSNQLSLSNANINKMKINVSQYQSAIIAFTEQYLTLLDTLKKSISLLIPKSQIELENHLAKFQPIINHQQVQTPIQIENDQSVHITSKEGKSNQNQQIKEQIPKPNQQNVQTLNQLIQLIEQKITNQKKQENKQQKSTMAQQLQQSNTNTQVPIQSNIPPIIKPTTQDDKQIENDTILVVSDEKLFQFMLGGSDISKIIYINQYIICGISGSKFYTFDISTQISDDLNLQSIRTIQSDSEFTDLEYFKLDDHHGFIYLATNKGNIFKLETEGEKNIKIKESLGCIHHIDKPGKLQIQVSAVDRQLYSIGEENIVKIWSLNTMKEQKRLKLQDYSTAFHVDWNCVFIGGNNQIQIWNQITGKINKLTGLEQRVNKILTNDSKLFVGLIDKIKIYNKTGLGELQMIKDLVLDKICLMQIIKTQSILVVSYIDNQVETVGLYVFTDLQPPQLLLEQSAQSCAVYEKDMVNQLAFVQKMGICLIYKMEQISQLSQ